MGYHGEMAMAKKTEAKSVKVRLVEMGKREVEGGGAGGAVGSCGVHGVAEPFGEFRAGGGGVARCGKAGVDNCRYSMGKGAERD